ncbi:hypothetical protein C0991_001854, partial [Blastosporella zonata]
MSKLKLSYSFNGSSPRPRLLPTVLVSLTLLLYLRFVWVSPPTPLVPVVSPESVSPSSPLSAPTPRILLVSALFPLEQAKHSHDDYKSWLQNLLGPHGVQCDMYFYTTPDLETLVSSLGPSSINHTHTLTIDTTYHNPFTVPPLSGFRSKYAQMHGWDRERAIHSPELYAVWNAKPWLLEHALIGREYDYAFWVDAGSFRAAHPFRTWPDPARVEEVFSNRSEGEVEDRVLIPLFKLPGREQFAWRVEKGPVDMDFSEGSFFGSTPSGVSWFAKTFYEAHDRYINTLPPSSPASARHPHSKPDGDEDDTTSLSTPQFHFVGKDQTLINSLLFRFPERFLGVLSPTRTHLLPPTPGAPDSPPYALTLDSMLA